MRLATTAAATVSRVAHRAVHLGRFALAFFARTESLGDALTFALQARAIKRKQERRVPFYDRLSTLLTKLPPERAASFERTAALGLRLQRERPGREGRGPGAPPSVPRPWLGNG